MPLAQPESGLLHRRPRPPPPRPLEASQTWSSLQALFPGLNLVETLTPFC